MDRRVITLYGNNSRTQLYTHLNTRGYKTVELSRAILPLGYFNIAHTFRNNFIEFYRPKNGKVVTDVIMIPDGLYSVADLNDTIQTRLVEKECSKGCIALTYIKERGRIEISLKPTYTVYIRKEMGLLLGFPGNTNFSAPINLGRTAPQFTPHTEYHITCNLVNKSKNLFNGWPSNILAILQPKPGDYGDSFEYKYGEAVPINKGGFSEIEVRVSDKNNRLISFDKPITIILTLK